MADVFLSYSRADRPRVEKIAAALEAAGVDVWWDKELKGGTVFTKETEAQLKAAKVVLVCWSAASIESNWVADEASYGRDRTALVPILIDAVEPKLGFRQYQTIDFSGWRGDAAAPEFVELSEAIALAIGAERPVTAASSPKASLTDQLRKPPILAGAALALVALVAAAFFLMKPRSHDAAPVAANEASAATAVTEAAAAPATDGVGLAVLPFIAMSNGPDDENFADGLTEELLNWLANVEGLNVPGRTTSFQFKGEAQDLKDIGTRLGVRYLLEGSVRRSGDALRITAQLIDSTTGFHLWSETYDRKLADIFEIQDEIARLVTTELLGAIPSSGAGNPASLGAVDPKAHELYLQGRSLWAQRNAGEAFDKFLAATEIDPGHYLAQAYLAVVASNIAGRGRGADLGNGMDVMTVAANALERARTLRPDASDVLFAQGWAIDSRDGYTGGAAGGEASEYYARAARANPRNVEALHALARYLPDGEARAATYRRILDIDPGLSSAAANLASYYIQNGDEAAAEALFDRIYVVAPDTPRDHANTIYYVGGDIARSAEYLLRDFNGKGFDESSRRARAVRLADLGAVNEAAHLYAINDADFSWRDFNASQALMLRGDFAGMHALAHKILETNTERNWVGYHASSALRMGDPAHALQSTIDMIPDVKEKIRISDANAGDFAAYNSAIALERLGRADEAAPIWARALETLEKSEKTGWRRDIAAAVVYVRLRRNDEAMAAFEAAYQKGFRFLYGFNCYTCVDDSFFNRNGWFEPIFGDPRFTAYVERIRKENAETLERLDAKYGFLAEIRRDMAEHPR